MIDGNIHIDIEKPRVETRENAPTIIGDVVIVPGGKEVDNIENK